MKQFLASLALAIGVLAFPVSALSQLTPPPGTGGLPAFCSSPGSGVDILCTNAIAASSFLAGTPTTAAKAALPAGAHGNVYDETSTSGVPAAAVDYIRADSVTHTIVQSVNGGAEVPLLPGAMTNITGVVTITGGGSLVGAVTNGVFAVGTPGTTIVISNIPQTYNHLHLIIMGAQSNSAAAQLDISVNGDASGTNYVNQFTSGAGSTASAFSVAGAPTFQLEALPSSTLTHQISSMEYVFPFYATTTFYKPMFSVGGLGLTATTQQTDELSGFWKSTAAISSMNLTIAGGFNFIAGTSVSIYGVI